jgi:hypothetical protein
MKKFAYMEFEPRWPSELIKGLNKLGEQGWECIYIGYGHGYAILKRESTFTGIIDNARL